MPSFSPRLARIFVFALSALAVAAPPATHPVAGVLLDPSGRPAADVDVLLVRRGKTVDRTNGRWQIDEDAITSRTDAAGRFAFDAPPFAPGAVLAATDAAFLASAVDASGVPGASRMMPWAFVEGTARVRDRPGAGELVHAWTAEWDDAYAGLGVVETTVTADLSGHYRAAVLPGEVVVGRGEHLFTSAGSRVGAVNQTYAWPGPGETARQDLGGGGRHVELRVTDAVGRPFGPWTMVLVRDRPRDHDAPYPKPVWPPESVGWDKARQQAFLTAFKNEPKTRAAELAARETSLRNAAEYYWVPVGADGLMVAQDLRPGTYLAVMRYSRAEPDGRRQYETWDCKIVVPPGDAATPLRLADVVLRPSGRVTVGDPAPALDAPTLDGGRVRSADFAGRFVWLHFSAGWCGACYGDTPFVVKTAQRYAGDGRLAVVCVSLDETPEDARRYVRAEKLPGMQAFVGKWDEKNGYWPMLRAFGATSIPYNALVAPDGKVIAVGFYGETIGPTLDAALGKKD